jgi:DNA-directed RNA polymerase subunit M/transcription elongation factor TFIIS
MDFCDECGNLLPAGERSGACSNCGASFERGSNADITDSGESDGGKNSTSDTSTPPDLEHLPTTSAGNIKKTDAIEWLESRDRPSSAELRKTVLEKPNDFNGSTFPTDISTIRLTGDAHFIETVAGLFQWMVDMEDYSRRVEINLQEIEDRDTGELTGNYALYLSVAERS